ncbi:ABC transporter permease [Sphingomonas sp. HDW15A]|uniref:ABC transporter permease n=1 Tax=Sphingomonas sp. HDW15A TaxID=2714942 RepID=UPI00140A5245|nr:FtsX-like permease family protein [Sphingomonas sp. HDW15A]QIK96570.1 ABC transporter permease [Sphingomonas sp. HDW15A]
MFGRTGLLLDIALKHLAKRRRQTIVGVAGVGVGVGFFLAVSAMMIGSQNDFIETLIDAAPHIIISDEIRSPSAQPAVTSNPDGAIEVHGLKPRTEVRGLWGWQEIVRAANGVPGAIASPSLSGAITLRVGGREEAVGLIGIDPDIEKEISTLEDNLVAGNLDNLKTQQGGAIITQEIADRLGVGMGDVVGATSPRGGSRSLRVAGLFGRGRSPFGAGTSTAYVLLREAQSLTGQPFIINRIGIKLDDPYKAEGIATELEQRFGYKAQSWQERSADFLGLLLTRNIIMYSVISAILLVASFGIYALVSSSVFDKSRDIAILRSIGFSSSDLQRIFIAEGVILAAVGVLAGWALGLVLMHVLGSLEFPISGRTERIPLDRRPIHFLLAGAASLACAAVAAWLPARKAARVDPVDILRGAA